MPVALIANVKYFVNIRETLKYFHNDNVVICGTCGSKFHQLYNLSIWEVIFADLSARVFLLR